MPETVLLAFEDQLAAAQDLAQELGLPCTMVGRHRFPDGELKLRLPFNAEATERPRQLVIYRSLHQPNEKLLELMLVARQARTWGVERLLLVTPYLAYMRQDIEFLPGEIVSQRVVGAFLAELFDGVITVDPHLHRIETLQEAIDLPFACALSGAPLLAERIAQVVPDAVLMGPDAESAQWIASAAAVGGFDHGVCTKVRHGDHDVRITLPQLDVRGRAVVLLDDVASSGRTVAEATRLLRAAGAATVDVAVTHALFAHDALAVIHAAGVRHVWSTDSIAHTSNAIRMAPTLARSIRDWLKQA